MSCPDAEETERDVSTYSNDGQSTTFLSPSEQAVEDRRLAERCGLKRTKSLAGFFRMFRISTRDVP